MKTPKQAYALHQKVA